MGNDVKLLWRSLRGNVLVIERRLNAGSFLKPALGDVIDAVRDVQPRFARHDEHSSVFSQGSGTSEFRNWRESDSIEEQRFLPANSEIPKCLTPVVSFPDPKPSWSRVPVENPNLIGVKNR